MNYRTDGKPKDPDRVCGGKLMASGK